MRSLTRGAERNKANVVGLAHLFERPANARIARQAFAAIGLEGLPPSARPVFEVMSLADAARDRAA
jgi:hypothetical protein